MTDLAPKIDFNAGFSDPAAMAVPWADAVDVLTTSEMFWLSTVRADGRPHVTPLPAIWLDGVLYFCTGPGEQKEMNLRRNPKCVLTTGTNQLRSGLDVIVEGVAERATDHDLLVRLAALWKSKLDWDFGITEDAFDDGMGNIGLVYGVIPVKVLSFGKSPYSQTTYRFGG